MPHVTKLIRGYNTFIYFNHSQDKGIVNDILIMSFSFINLQCTVSIIIIRGDQRIQFGQDLWRILQSNFAGSAFAGDMSHQEPMRRRFLKFSYHTVSYVMKFDVHLSRVAEFLDNLLSDGES